MEDRNVKSIIDTAIQKEREAHEFYKDLYNFVEDTITKDALLFLAEEEKKHAVRNSQFGIRKKREHP